MKNKDRFNRKYNYLHKSFFWSLNTAHVSGINRDIDYPKKAVLNDEGE